MNRYSLKLYIAGQTVKSRRALANLRHIADQELAGRYDIRVIDVLEYPDAADDERIIATPTLIKELPVPMRRIIGDLSEREKVLFGLDLVPEEEP